MLTGRDGQYWRPGRADRTPDWQLERADQGLVGSAKQRVVNPVPDPHMLVVQLLA